MDERKRIERTGWSELKTRLRYSYVHTYVMHAVHACSAGIRANCRLPKHAWMPACKNLFQFQRFFAHTHVRPQLLRTRWNFSTACLQDPIPSLHREIKCYPTKRETRAQNYNPSMASISCSLDWFLISSWIWNNSFLPAIHYGHFCAKYLCSTFPKD